MSNYIILLKKYPLAISFLIFSLLFHLSMYTSKSIQAIFFDENGSLSNYGLSYSAMAFAGIFSAYIGKKIEKYDKKTSMQIAILLYSIGLLLRILPNSPIISIISGFISGLGASTVLLLMRVWIINIGTENDRATVISLKEVIDGIGSSLGTFISGILVAILSWYFNNSLQLVLVIASIMCFISLYFVPKIEETEEKEEYSNDKVIKSNFIILKIGTVTFGIIMGLSVSMFGPYIPVILKYQNIDISLIGIILTILGIFGIYCSSAFSGKKTNKYKQYIFLISEALVGIISFLLILELNYVYIIILLMARVFFLHGSAITQELIELDMYPKKEVAYFYGLSQTSFFIGDAIGGVLSGYIYSYSLKYSLIIFCIISISHSILLFVFYNYIKRKKYA